MSTELKGGCNQKAFDWATYIDAGSKRHILVQLQASRVPQPRDDFQDSSTKFVQRVEFVAYNYSVRSVDYQLGFWPAPSVGCGIRSLHLIQLGSGLNLIPTEWQSTRRLTIVISAVERSVRCRELDEYRMGE